MHASRALRRRVAAGATAFVALVAAPTTGLAHVDLWPPHGELAFVSGRAGNDELFVTDTDGRGVRRLTRTSEDEEAPVWSPRGDVLAFARHGDVFVVTNGGGKARNVTRSAGAEEFEPAWSPDGGTLALTCVGAANYRSSICAIRADGSSRRVLTQRRAADDSQPAWSPGGRTIAFVRTPRHGRSAIFVMRRDGTHERRLLGGVGYDAYAPAWSPTGNRIAVVVKPAGSTFGAEIAVARADGHGLRQLTSVGGAGDPSWSPDGTTIAFSTNHAGGGRTEIYLVRVRDRAVRRVPLAGRFNAEPAWRPAR